MARRPRRFREGEDDEYALDLGNEVGHPCEICGEKLSWCKAHGFCRECSGWTVLNGRWWKSLDEEDPDPRQTNKCRACGRWAGYCPGGCRPALSLDDTALSGDDMAHTSDNMALSSDNNMVPLSGNMVHK